MAVMKKTAPETLMVVAPTLNRATTCTTHTVFPEMKYVVENVEQHTEYLIAGVPKKNLVISRIDRSKGVNGKTLQCEWICENLVPKGAWFVLLDDNVKGLTGVDPWHYGERILDVQNPRDDGEPWRNIFGHNYTGKEFLEEIAPEDVVVAERIGARMVGYALVDNPFFRAKKYREVGFVIGKLTLMKNEGLTWDHSITMDDFRNTADHLFRFGCVLINNYIYPVRKHYMAGGHGTREERKPFRRADCIKLMAQYPGLFTKKKPTPDIPDDLSVRFTSRSQVQEWRKALFAKVKDKKV